MQSLRSTAALLAAADSTDRLAPLLAPLGFAGPFLPLDRSARAALGIADTLEDVRVARGPGTLRALLATARRGEALRAVISRVVSRVASRAGHALWLLVVHSGDGAELAFAAWSGDRRPPRIAALTVDRARVVDSDAETLCAMAAVGTEVDVITHARWIDLLGRDALTRRFYRSLERIVGEMAAALPGPAAGADRRELALLQVSRLIFLSFLEAKGWLDRDRGFLARTFDQCMAAGGGYHSRILAPLFFGTLNTPVHRRASAARGFGAIPFLNGGLFTVTPLERRHRRSRFPDAAFGMLFGDLLTRYRFTAHEESTSWSEAAIDPEMLGKAFESLMASDERRASGAYYTPQALVEEATEAALVHALDGDVPRHLLEAALRGERLRGVPAAGLCARLSALRIFDPACGSGAFLVHGLDRLAALRMAAGDAGTRADIRRAVLAASIFGVDMNPMAVWLCELRLWLSIMIEGQEEDPLQVPPLPNLDHHVRVGDTLAGGDFTDAARGRPTARLTLLRGRYARATGRRKHALAEALDAEERALAVAGLTATIERVTVDRRAVLAVVRGRDLFGDRAHPDGAQAEHLEMLRARVRDLRAQRRRIVAGGALPFSFASRYADVGAAGGFGVIVGNPPWVRLHRIPPEARATLRRDFEVFRAPGWQRGIQITQSGSAFGSQVDLAALFVERSLALLRPGGAMALLLPAKLWRSLAGGSVRRLLAARARVLAVIDWSSSPPSFDAAVYPSLLVAERPGIGEAHTARRMPGSEPRIAIAIHRRDQTRRWDVPAAALALDDGPGSPWVLAPLDVRAAFDRVTAAGVPLAESPLGRPYLGVKCGYNEAFVVTRRDHDDLSGIVGADGRRAVIEASLLRPALRGERVLPWHAMSSDECLIWTHDTVGSALPVLPAHAARWFAPLRRRLERRSDHRGGRWWGLFRTEAASAAGPRVVWADIARRPRAAVLLPGDPTVPLNSCYVVRCRTTEDALAFAALLNSPIAAAWLNVLAEPARGDYRRYLGWTMALFPVPAAWETARGLLSPLAQRAMGGDAPTDAELLDIALAAYAMPRAAVSPLLEWNAD